jgi:hypothetical protein
MRALVAPGDDAQYLEIVGQGRRTATAALWRDSQNVALEPGIRAQLRSREISRQHAHNLVLAPLTLDLIK